MTIDYDRLKTLRDESTPGPWTVDIDEEWGEVIVANEAGHLKSFVGGQVSFEMKAGSYDYDTHLVALAPDMAAELLRLRDGSSQLLAKKRAAVERLYSTDPVTAAVLEGMCDELEKLLGGDTE